MTDELKELCPFCGGEPIAEKKENSIAHWIVRCVECRALVEGTTEAQAIDGWNRRVSNNTTIIAFYHRVCERAERNMELTGIVSGAHWNAMRQVLKEMGINVEISDNHANP